MPTILSPAMLLDATRRTASDWLLGSLGVSAAAVSASFAIYMVVAGPVGPRAGSGFTIFVPYDGRVRPETTTAAAPIAALPAPAAAHRALAALGEADIDFTPTGSIAGEGGRRSAGGVAPAQRDAGRAAPRLEDFVIRDIFDGKAVIEAHNKLQLVERGSVIEGIGPVLSVESRGNAWVIETGSGVIRR